MKPCDDPLYAEIMDDSPTDRGLTRRAAELSPVERGDHGLFQPLDLSMAARAAIELLNLPPSLIARFIRPVRRIQKIKDAKAAAEVMGHIRRLSGEYDLMRRDVMETQESIIRTALDIDRLVRNHHKDVALDALTKQNAIDAARDGQLQRRQIRQRSAPILSGSAPRDAGAAAVNLNSSDELSNKARVTLLKGIASLDADAISEAYVAYAALAFATKLNATNDEDEARASAFSDVREMLAANAFTAKDAAGFVAALKVVRADMRKAKSAKAGLGTMAAGIKGGGQ